MKKKHTFSQEKKRTLRRKKDKKNEDHWALDTDRAIRSMFEMRKKEESKNQKVSKGEIF